MPGFNHACSIGVNTATLNWLPALDGKVLIFAGNHTFARYYLSDV